MNSDQGDAHLEKHPLSKTSLYAFFFAVERPTKCQEYSVIN